jgi:hypothetical protein
MSTRRRDNPLKTVMLSALTALVLVAVPAQGASHTSRTDCRAKKLLTSYSAHYYAVKEMHGSRAPGRNIRRWGLKGGRQSSCRQIARSMRLLRRMHFPGSSLLSPGAPFLPPAHIASLRARSGIAECIGEHESGGSYTAVDPSGTYRGKYQFDYATFAAAGGHGDPARASPAEQDAAFARYWPGHHGAWPNTSRMCGY